MGWKEAMLSKLLILALGVLFLILGFSKAIVTAFVLIMITFLIDCFAVLIEGKEL